MASSMKIPIKFTDHLQARKGSAKRCIIATAARNQWGGDWTVTTSSAEHVSESGQAMRWRLSASAQLTAMLFDAGIRLPVRSVRLVRGRKVTKRDRIQSPPKPKASRAQKPRNLRRAAAGATVAGALLVAANGLEWVVYAVAGALIAAAVAVTVRRHRRDGVLTPVPAGPSRITEPQPGGAAPSFTRPGRWEPEPEPVQPAAPKAAPVMSEPGRELVPVVQEVVNARN